jgi:RNA polymerase sigma-70 factor (ECF subfamily)
MEPFQDLIDPSSRVARNIRVSAGRLARSGVVPGMDIDDVEQDLRLDLIRRAGKFDPSKASFDTFADRVITHRVADLAKPTHAKAAERCTLSLDEPIGGSDDEEGLCLSEVLPESSALHPADEFSLTHGRDLRRDVSRLFTQLPPAARSVAAALCSGPVTEAARSLGLHRSTVYQHIASIRNAAAALGLQEYLGHQPDSFGPSPVNDRRDRTSLAPGLRGNARPNRKYPDRKLQGGAGPGAHFLATRQEVLS